MKTAAVALAEKSGSNSGVENSYHELERRFLEPAWYALHTRSRHEKLVSGLISKKGFETFLPLRRIKRRWSDRIQIIDEPLFKGYLFVRAPLIQRLSILMTKGAVRLVGFNHLPSPVPEKDILAIQQFIAEEIEVDPFPYLKEGQLVVVKNGPFRGTSGFLVRKKNRYRLVISLDLIQQSASIEIDSACVEPL